MIFWFKSTLSAYDDQLALSSSLTLYYTYYIHPWLYTSF